MWRVLRELWDFSWQQKKYWLAPIILALALVGILIVISESGAMSAFIYPLF